MDRRAAYSFSTKTNFRLQLGSKRNGAGASSSYRWLVPTSRAVTARFRRVWGHDCPPQVPCAFSSGSVRRADRALLVVLASGLVAGNSGRGYPTDCETNL